MLLYEHLGEKWERALSENTNIIKTIKNLSTVITAINGQLKPYSLQVQEKSVSRLHVLLIESHDLQGSRCLGLCEEGSRNSLGFQLLQTTKIVSRYWILKKLILWQHLFFADTWDRSSKKSAI